MRLLLAALSYLLSLAATAALCFFLVLVVAGPHAGLLPAWLEPVALVAGWLVVLVLPIIIARAVWRRLGGGRQDRRKGATPAAH